MDQRTIALADIRVPAKRAKTLDKEKLQLLADDILEHGQKTPIQVRKDGTGFVLIEGLHRLEALRTLGETRIEAYIVHARLH